MDHRTLVGQTRATDDAQMQNRLLSLTNPLVLTRRLWCSSIVIGWHGLDRSQQHANSTARPNSLRKLAILRAQKEHRKNTTSYYRIAAAGSCCWPRRVVPPALLPPPLLLPSSYDGAAGGSSCRIATSHANHWQALAGKARTRVGLKPAHRALRPPSLHNMCSCFSTPVSQLLPGWAVCIRVFATSSGNTVPHICSGGAAATSAATETREALRVCLHVFVQG